MTAANSAIIIMLVGGCLLWAIGYGMNSKSSFEDGSFLLQIVFMTLGAALIVIGLLWKLIISLLYMIP